MRIGAVFPQTEIGADSAVVADFARAAEDLGCHHLAVYDHVLGAVPRGSQWLGYTHVHMFHEPFVLFGFLAGITRNIELATSILVLPQRQTALVAKQAAEVDVLSRGRLRLGIGVGWNDVEYEALNQDFHNRAARIEEQVKVLRSLWTQDIVTFEGRFHRIVRAGINPLPVQRPIPIWMGGESDTVLRRIARFADGWITGWKLGSVRTRSARHPVVPGGFKTLVARLREYGREFGRDPSGIGLERCILYSEGPDEWRRVADEWRSIGGTHLTVLTMRSGLTSPAEHITAIRRVLDVLTHS